MRTYLHQQLAAALADCEIERRGGAEQICFEIEALQPEVAIGRLTEWLQSWSRAHLVARFEVGATFRAVVLDRDEVVPLVQQALQSQRVVAVLDPTSFGGCKFDFTRTGPDSIELLVTCWGARESGAQTLQGVFGRGRVFRGN